MRFDYLRGEHVHVVELVDLGAGRWRATWTLRAASPEARGDEEPLAERSLELEALPVGESTYSVRLAHEAVELRVEHEGLARTVLQGGQAASFEFLDPYRVGTDSLAVHEGGPVEIVSPMPGRVVQVKVSEGEQVEQGQTVVVVEAMKMANEHRSPISGTVGSLRCTEGQAVEAGAVLLVIEPPASA